MKDNVEHERDAQAMMKKLAFILKVITLLVPISKHLFESWIDLCSFFTMGQSQN